MTPRLGRYILKDKKEVFKHDYNGCQFGVIVLDSEGNEIDFLHSFELALEKYRAIVPTSDNLYYCFKHNKSRGGLYFKRFDPI